MNRSNSIIMILKNSHSTAQIPLSLGENVIYSEMFPDFSKKKFILFKIHVSSMDNFTIKTNEEFPIKLRFLSKPEGKILDEKVFYNKKEVELNSLYHIEILHLFSKNHFFIENSDNVNFNENLVEMPKTASLTGKKNDKSLSDISLLHENTDISMLAREDDISKMEDNTDMKNLDEPIAHRKHSLEDNDIRKNLGEEFDAISRDDNVMTPVKKRKESKVASIKKSSEKLTMRENVPPKQQNAGLHPKPAENVIFPKKARIIDDDETPVKHHQNEYSTPIKPKNVEKNSPLLRSKRKRDSEATKCPICLESIRDCSKLDTCLHQFCKECIDQWSNLSNTCPVCKEEFKKIQYLQEDKTLEKKVKKRKFHHEEEVDESWLENCADDCMVCGKNDNQHLLLVCDKCNYNICHVGCAGLDLIPDEDWLCSECVQKGRRRPRVVSAPRVNTRSRMQRGYSLRSKRK